VLFTNSGAEANEAALKLSRRLRPAAAGSPARAPSTAAPSARSPSPGQPPSAPRSSRCPGPVTFVPYGDADGPARGRRRPTASVVLEPGHGRGRRRRPAAGLPRGRRAALRRRRRAAAPRRGARAAPAGSAPGRPAPSSRPGAVPDVVTLAKALAGRLRSAPSSPTAGRRRPAEGRPRTTFGGNPVSRAPPRSPCCAR
jgi:acetylornithine aminotransferase